MPLDILWLFRKARQSTFIPFSTEVDHSFRTTVQRVEMGYTDLSKFLVDQFSVSTRPAIHYESILDLKDEFTLDQYRVNDLLP